MTDDKVRRKPVVVMKVSDVPQRIWQRRSRVAHRRHIVGGTQLDDVVLSAALVTLWWLVLGLVLWLSLILLLFFHRNE